MALAAIPRIPLRFALVAKVARRGFVRAAVISACARGIVAAIAAPMPSIAAVLTPILRHIPLPKTPSAINLD